MAMAASVEERRFSAASQRRRRTGLCPGRAV